MKKEFLNVNLLLIIREALKEESILFQNINNNKKINNKFIIRILKYESSKLGMNYPDDLHSS